MPEKTDYDALPYPDYLHPQTHPARLASIARLFGHAAPPLTGARILELGCSNGAGLIAMALTLPNSQLVGLDLAASRIAEGQARIDALGLKNISLIADSFLNDTALAGEFDYIIAHGLFSWLPPALREGLLQRAQALLSPKGIFFVSYNTQPGWSTRRAMGEAMRYFTDEKSPPLKRADGGLAILKALAKGVHAPGSWYQKSLKEEVDRLEGYDRSYLFHEYMGADNAPYFFHEFMAAAQGHGLQFLAEAEDLQWLVDGVDGLPPELDPIPRQQYIDFLVQRYFRQSLLIRGEAQEIHHLNPEAVGDLYIRSALRFQDPARGWNHRQSSPFFLPDSGLVAEADPLIKSLFIALEAHFPQAISVKALIDEARAQCAWAASPSPARDHQRLMARLLRAFIASDVDFLPEADNLPSPGAKCVYASPLALHGLKAGRIPHTLFLAKKELDPASSLVLAHLETPKDLKYLVEKIAPQLPATGPEGQILEKNAAGIDVILRYLGREGFLLAG